MQLETLGPYRIGKQIGKGGMGAVYEAVDESPGRDGMRVAVKALVPQLASTEGFRERFEAEIDSLKQLKHEGIVRLYGYGEQEGVLFYSMELVEGTNLEEELLSGRRFDWKETVDFGIQICHALKHAHDHGVVHRDIKPANLLLTSEGKIKIADFGIARLFGGTQLTIAGGVLGTADYMSPEQADGRTVSEKCDQYSLGGVLYALLAGRPPFKAKTMPEMLQMQRFAEPEPVKRYSPETPDQLNKLISQLLSKEPADRFPNVLVLGRHMVAMKKALSRPDKEEQGTVDTQVGTKPTNVLPEAAIEKSKDATVASSAPIPIPNDGETDEAMRELFEAPTLAESIEPAPSRPSADEPAKPQVSPSHASTKRRFTTIDEEVRRERELARDSIVWRTAQLVGMAVAIGVLIWGGNKLMQPPTSEELYESIIAEIDEHGAEDLRLVKSKLEDFLDRFPEDTHHEEIEDYYQQLEFQKFERQARRKSRTRTAGSSNPVEIIYRSSLSIAENDPALGLDRLRSLLALYDPNDQTLDTEALRSDKNSKDPNFPWLVLARKQLEELTMRVQQQSVSQLPQLEERFEKATQLQSTNPKQAAAMYQAIIDLYANQPWANTIVQSSKLMLDRIASGETN